MTANPTVFFPEPKKAVIEDREIPKPGKGEVLVKTSKSLISTGTEMTAFGGDFPAGSNWEKYFSCPYYPGYNNVGTVVETGLGVDRSLLGKRLASGGKHSAYTVAEIKSADAGESEKAAGRVGTYHIPDSLSDEHAVFFTIPEIVMNGIRSAKVQWGECAVVYGLGLLGQFVVRFCRQSGAFPVVGVDISDTRLRYLPEDRAVIGINANDGGLLEKIKEANHGRLADVVFEVTGNAGLMEQELSLLREKGRLLILSSPRQKTVFDFQDYCAWKSYSIIGCHNFSHPLHPQVDNPWTIDRHVEFFFDLAAAKELDLDRLVSRKVDYASAPSVYADLLRDRSNDMGIILDWESAS